MAIWIYLCLFALLPFCGESFQFATPLTTVNPVQVLNISLSALHEFSWKDHGILNEIPRNSFEFFYNVGSLKGNIGNSSNECFQAVLTFTEDMLNGERYPLFVFDSWGKLESGVFLANQKWLGNYQECTSSEYVRFQGKYCFLSLHNITYGNVFIEDEKSYFEIGACFPKSCSQSQISSAFDQVYHNITVFCPEQYTSWSGLDIFGLVVCITLASIVILSTLAHLLINRNKTEYILLQEVDSADEITGKKIFWFVSFKKAVWKVLHSFSIFTNLNGIFNMEQKPTDISCLHGMRFLSISWVILGHTLLFTLSFSDNIVSLFGYVLKHWEFQAISNASYSVDTFFFLSGLLVTYLGCRQMAQNDGKLNVLKMYLYRYIRLTPMYAFVILCIVTVYPKLIEAPLWPEINHDNIRLCSQYWYTNLLYINNVYPANVGQECYAIGWYLSNDFQFYILSPIFIILLHNSQVGFFFSCCCCCEPLFQWFFFEQLAIDLEDEVSRDRKPKVGMFAMAFVLLASVVITGAFSSHTEQQPFGELFGIISKYGYSMAYGHPTNLTPPSLVQPTQNIYIADIYAKPWCRIGAYMIGMMTGYALYINGNEIKMPKAVAVIGWTVTAVTCCSILYCLYPSFSNDRQLSVNTAALYNALSRPIWSLCMAWVTIACSCGYGGVVHAFLSWKGFIPLSRLTYCLYLVHPLIIWWFIGASEKLIHFTIPTYILLYLGTIMVSCAVALVCALVVEYPFVALSKLVLRPTGSKPVRALSVVYTTEVLAD